MWKPGSTQSQIQTAGTITSTETPYEMRWAYHGRWKLSRVNAPATWVGADTRGVASVPVLDSDIG